MNNQKEIWKDVLGYEGIYQVSNLGNIKSIDRWFYDLNGRNYHHKERILKPKKNKYGYFTVTLSLKSKIITKSIHQLVAIAFLNHKVCGYKLVVNHIDFDRLNNNVNNLEIITTRENTNKKHLKCSSKYIGVTWNKKQSKFISQIIINQRKIHIGVFTIELEASNMYQKALKYINKYNGNNSDFRTYLKSL